MGRNAYIDKSSYMVAIVALFLSFIMDKYIEKLNLSGNSIKDEGFISICKALKDNKNLEILNISNNDIHSQGLTQGLNLITSCKITSLNLSQNKLQDTVIKILSNSLQFFPNLCKLNLSYCGFEFNWLRIFNQIFIIF